MIQKLLQKVDKKNVYKYYSKKNYRQNVNQNNNKTMTRKIMIKLQKFSITNCSKHGNRIIKSKIIPLKITCLLSF